MRSSAGPAIGTSVPDPGGTGTESSWRVQSGRIPLARRRIRVRHVSPPASSTTPDAALLDVQAGLVDQ